MTNPKEPATDAREVVAKALHELDDLADTAKQSGHLSDHALFVRVVSSVRALNTALEGENAELRAADRDHLAATRGMEKRLTARCEALELALREAGEALRPFLPITVNDTPDYAELAFGEHQTQAMTMQPNDWLALNTVAARIQAVVGTEGGA